MDSNWTHILDEGDSLDAFYYDFMKAFDETPHKRMIHKICKYGVKGNVLGLISSFLSTQLVSVGSAEGKRSNVASGIPQGRVLGPMLFLICINDLPKVVGKNRFCISLRMTLKSSETLQQNMTEFLQRDIDILEKWWDT